MSLNNFRRQFVCHEVRRVDGAQHLAVLEPLLRGCLLDPERSGDYAPCLPTPFRWMIPSAADASPRIPPCRYSHNPSSSARLRRLPLVLPGLHRIRSIRATMLVSSVFCPGPSRDDFRAWPLLRMWMFELFCLQPNRRPCKPEVCLGLFGDRT